MANSQQVDGQPFPDLNVGPVEYLNDRPLQHANGQPADYVTTTRGQKYAPPSTAAAQHPVSIGNDLSGCTADTELSRGGMSLATIQDSGGPKHTLPYHMQPVSSKQGEFETHSINSVIGIPMLKIRRSHGRLIFNMGIPMTEFRHYEENFVAGCTWSLYF